MEWLFQLLFGWWWYGEDGRTKTADSSEKYLLPVLILVCIVCVIALVVFLARK